MRTERVGAALQMAIRQHKPGPGLLLHSDRGSRYAGSEYQQLTRHGIICSMSRKGNCGDNAVMERFFLNLKAERVWPQAYATPDAAAQRDIGACIGGFYNDNDCTRRLATCRPLLLSS